jgi:16S rRNA (guanine527-N7)-methyltransferase
MAGRREPASLAASPRTRADARTQLIAGARELGLALAEEAAERLLELLDALERWNAAYNLTSIVQREEMLTHHLLDSLAVHADLHGTTVADAGTGAGFPGLPLALACAERRFTLIDSAQKKTRFVAHAARLLRLGNVDVVHARVEALRPVRPFDCVVARAFAPLARLLEQVRPLCGPDTRVLALKGRRPEAELAALEPPWSVLEVRTLKVPGLEEERHLVVLQGRDL